MADTFFGFSPELPTFEDEKEDIISRGLPGADDEVREEFIDSLNEDTFGTGALEDDWEAAHKKLAGLAEEIRAQQQQRTEHNKELSSDPEEDFLEESITRFVLDDGADSPEQEEFPESSKDLYVGKSQAVPIKPERASVWAGSPVASPTEPTMSPTLEQLISPSTNIWSMQYQHGKENYNRGPLNIPKNQQTSLSHGPTQSAPAYPSPGGHPVKIRPSGRVIQLEDLEKQLTGDSEPHTVPITPIGHTKQRVAPDRDATPQRGPYRVPPPPPGLHLPQGRSPQLPMPLMRGTPPRGFPLPQGYRGSPFQPHVVPRWSMRTPQNMHRPRQVFFHSDPGHLGHHMMHDQRFMGQQGWYGNRHHHPHHHYNRDHFPPHENSEDEYAGLMTQKEKEWLIKIQLLQLTSINPDLDDYYYQKYVSKQTARERAMRGEGLEQGLGRNGDAAAELPHFPHREERSYKTVEFEGSLGKVSVGSVNHPRQIVDNPKDAKSFYHEMSVSRSQKESRRKSSILLKVESVYNILLELEALQKRVICSTEDERKTLYHEREECINRIFSLLRLRRSPNTGEIEDDFFMQMMAFKKGKALLTRVMPILKQDQGELVLLSITKNVVTLMKKDVQEEVLLQSISTVCRSIHQSSPSVISMCLRNMVLETSLQPTLQHVVTNKFGISMLTALLQRGLDIKNAMDNSSLELQTVWEKAIERVSQEVQGAPTALLSKGLPATITLIQFLALHTNRQTAALLQDQLRIMENNKVQ